MDNNNGSASSTPLSKEEKEIRTITKITTAIMAALKKTNLTKNQITSSSINENQLSTASKYFKLEEIGFFDLELGIEDDNTITSEKLWIQNIFVFI